MPLLTALIDKNSHILAEIYFIILKKSPKSKSESLSIPNLHLS